MMAVDVRGAQEHHEQHDCCDHKEDREAAKQHYHRSCLRIIVGRRTRIHYKCPRGS